MALPTQNNFSEQLRQSPAAIGAVNLMVYGCGYLFLHAYRRFFISLLILLIFDLSLGILGIVVSYLIVILDCARITKKIQRGKKELPRFSGFLTTISILCIVVIISFTLLPKYLFAFSETSCDLFYPITFSFDFYSDIQSISKNTDCKNKIKGGETLFTFYKKPGLKDEV